MTNPPITALLKDAAPGSESYDRLLELVYLELRQIAQRKISRESAAITMGATGLVHEAWLRLGAETEQFENRRHFFGAAAEAMRRILIERARAAARQKRGAGALRITLQDHHVSGADADVDLLALDQVLSKLEQRDGAMANVVKLRYFAGLTVNEVAEVLDVGPRTVDRLWQGARAWIKVQLA